MKKFKVLWGMAQREKIVRDMIFWWLIIAAGIPVAQSGWSLDALEAHYTRMGIWHDLWYIAVVPTAFALVLGAIEMSWYLSSSTGNGSTEEKKSRNHVK